MWQRCVSEGKGEQSGGVDGVWEKASRSAVSQKEVMGDRRRCCGGCGRRCRVLKFGVYINQTGFDFHPPLRGRAGEGS